MSTTPRKRWSDWARRLVVVTERAEALGSPRAPGLRQECKNQLRSWYGASRWRGGGLAPEDLPELARRLRGRAAD